MSDYHEFNSPTYHAQCKTFALAKEMTGITANVTFTKTACLKPPHCLRIVPAYRTESMQAFRDSVAAEMRDVRAKR